MKIGLLVETEEGLTWPQWRRMVTTADRLGFDSIWISDHLQSPWAAERHGLDPWLALAVAARDTHRLVLGTLVSPITFRPAVIMARMAESLDALSGGRFVLGLGLGWNTEEHIAAGIPFPSVGERKRRMMEAIERIRAELGERRVPILIGGSGRKVTLPLVARYADAWNMTSASVEDYRQASGELDRLCLSVGRDPREIHRSVATGVLSGYDATDLHARGERLRRLVPPLNAVGDVCEAARQMGWMVGTREEIRSHLRVFESAGVERVIFGFYDLEDLTVLKLIAP